MEERECVCVRVQHTHHRPKAHSRLDTSTHVIPCTYQARAHAHAHAMLHMRIGWSSCCASSTSSTPSRTARCAHAYRIVRACYNVHAVDANQDAEDELRP